MKRPDARQYLKDAGYEGGYRSLGSSPTHDGTAGIKSAEYQAVLDIDDWREASESGALNRLSPKDWFRLMLDSLNRSAATRGLYEGYLRPDVDPMTLVIQAVREGYVPEDAQNNLKSGLLDCIRHASETRRDGAEEGIWGDEAINELVGKLGTFRELGLEFLRPGLDDLSKLLEAMGPGDGGWDDPRGVIGRLIDTLALES